MISNFKVHAIIPARAGSERIKNKNIKLFAGKPLISWTIEAAINSSLIDNVIVTSDCPHVLSIALQFGVNKLNRPKELATDISSTDDVLFHCIDEMKIDENDIFILLQPTSPMRTSDQIDEALSMFKSVDVEAVVSVCKCEHSPLWSNTLPDTDSMNEFVNSDILSVRSQDLPIFYRLNGAIFSYRVSRFVSNKGRKYDSKTFAYVMPRSSSVDIDTVDDFKVAECLFSI